MKIDYFSKIKILDGGMGQTLLEKGLKAKGSFWSATALIDKKYHPIYNTNRAKAERYFSNVEHFIKHPIKNWICGHSHSLTNIHLNGVNLCINPFVSQKSHLINLNFVNL